MAAEECVQRILVVDDEASITRLLEQLLLAEGYQVAVARDGLEALALVPQFRPDLILLDLDMPQLHGYDVCRRLKQDSATRLIPVLILTGQDSMTARFRGWDLGADEFLTKPFHGLEVTARCRSLLRAKRLVDELDSAQAVVFALARTVEAKSRYTQGHAERVASYALVLAERLGLTEKEREVLRQGAVLHDIGKISTPDAILNKPARLTRAEYEVVQEHVLAGVRIVEPLRSIRDVVPLIRSHHERMDGNGYPDRLNGASIPLLARVLAVADVYDALSSERPYRRALGHQDCLVALRENAAGGGLDGRLVHDFCQAFPRPPAEETGPTAKPPREVVTS